MRMPLIAATQSQGNANARGGLLVALVLGLALGPGCAAPISRPAGVPDTPYWFVAADSAYWYQAAESLAVVQFAQQTGDERVEQQLYALRKLGWRMTPERGPALQRAGQEQQLSQVLFQVERVEGATSPTDDRRAFERRFWSGRNASREPLKGILPGLRLFGEPFTRYFYPCCLSITWRDSLTAAEAEEWLSNGQYAVLTSPQMSYQYYVQRTWVIELPAGTELFGALRDFNANPLIETAYPISSLREPPSPDPRDPGRNLLGATVEDSASAAPPPKWSPSLWGAYRIARFAGFAAPVAGAAAVPVEGERFRVLVSLEKSQTENDSTLVTRYGGSVVAVDSGRLEAWIPFAALPELAREPGVRRLDTARR